MGAGTTPHSRQIPEQQSQRWVAFSLTQCFQHASLKIKRRHKRQGLDFKPHLECIKSRSDVIPFTKEMTEQTGDIDEMHFADAR